MEGTAAPITMGEGEREKNNSCSFLMAGNKEMRCAEERGGDEINWRGRTLGTGVEQEGETDRVCPQAEVAKK